MGVEREGDGCYHAYTADGEIGIIEAYPIFSCFFLVFFVSSAWFIGVFPHCFLHFFLINNRTTSVMIGWLGGVQKLVTGSRGMWFIVQSQTLRVFTFLVYFVSLHQ